MERDRRRDAVLARSSHRVLRFTHRQVRRRPTEVTTAIRAALHGSVLVEPAQRA
jgi:very-short-patch-repair endonuclease